MSNFAQLVRRFLHHTDETTRSPAQVLERMMQRYEEQHPKEKLDRKSVVDKLKAMGLSDEKVSLEGRGEIARYYGIKDYTGTEEQNAAFIELLMDDDDLWHHELHASR